MQDDDSVADSGSDDPIYTLGVLVVGWPFILLIVVGFGVRWVESAIERDVAKALHQEGFRTVQVEVSNRDVLLSGVVEGRIERQRAVAAAAQSAGVRRVVTSALDVRVPPPPEPPPPAPAGPSAQETDAIDRIHQLLYSGVRFEPGRSALASDAKEALAQIAEILEANPGIEGTVEAHLAPATLTSHPGLDERRAMNVVGFLVARHRTHPPRYRRRASRG